MLQYPGIMAPTVQEVTFSHDIAVQVLQVQEAFPGLQGWPLVLGVSSTQNQHNSPARPEAPGRAFLLPTLLICPGSRMTSLQEKHMLLKTKRAKKQLTSLPDRVSG